MLLLVDEEGCGTVFSFNGMQRSLGECLLGKSGVGKLSVGVMTVEETKEFLRSGDLQLDGDQLKDNYDVALYRPITAENYQKVLEQAAPYFTAEKNFSVLYEAWATEEDTVKKAEYQKTLDQMGFAGKAEKWGIMTMGEQTLAERILMFLMVF